MGTLRPKYLLYGVHGAFGGFRVFGLRVLGCRAWVCLVWGSRFEFRV